MNTYNIARQHKYFQLKEWAPALCLSVGLFCFLLGILLTVLAYSSYTGYRNKSAGPFLMVFGGIGVAVGKKWTKHYYICLIIEITLNAHSNYMHINWLTRSLLRLVIAQCANCATQSLLIAQHTHYSTCSLLNPDCSTCAVPNCSLLNVLINQPIHCST